MPLGERELELDDVTIDCETRRLLVALDVARIEPSSRDVVALEVRFELCAVRRYNSRAAGRKGRNCLRVGLRDPLDGPASSRCSGPM